MDESRMTVPAFLINDQPRSHISRSKVSGWPMITGIHNKGAVSPANSLVFRIIPETITAAIPTKYALGATYSPSKQSTCDKRDNGYFSYRE